MQARFETKGSSPALPRGVARLSARRMATAAALALAVSLSFAGASEGATLRASETLSAGLLQQAELTGAAQTGEFFGHSVALSADGDTAIVGAPGRGRVWIFSRSGASWAQQGEPLTPDNESGGQARFGESVALSANGDTALIGGPWEGPQHTGAAWIFTRSGETWTQQGGMITGKGAEARAQFGHSVALSADGGTALIGGPGEVAEFGVQGAAWVFTRSGETWTQQGERLTGAGEQGQAGFADRVALSGDGATALIGGPNDQDGIGAVWAFIRAGSTWSAQGAKLTANDEVNGYVLRYPDEGPPYEAFEGGRFGEGLALSADGDTALIGGPDDSLGEGAVWTFTRSGELWSQQGSKLARAGAHRPENGELFDAFGRTVDISADGSTLLVGAEYEAHLEGSVWVFDRSGPGWVERETLTGSDGRAGYFGGSIAPSSDGGTVLIGGSDSDPFGEGYGEGAAWVFDSGAQGGTPSPPAVVTAPVSPSSVTETTAPLRGSVNPNGTSVGSCVFEYGESEAYGSSAPCSALPGTGTTTRPVGVELTGLQRGTAYHFRLAATNAGGTSRGDDQTFTTPAVPSPIVTRLSRHSGPASGGTSVRITGSNFAGATAVTFRAGEGTPDAPASFVVNSDSSITVTTPAHVAGETFVSVTRGGPSAITTASEFTFRPTVTAIAPASGPRSGGTDVTITGSGFVVGSETALFRFGDRVVHAVECTSATTCTAVTPRHSAGTVRVRAFVNGALSRRNDPADLFTYA
jgi:IPT/TIG domain